MPILLHVPEPETMKNPTAAMLVIGDEILSGRTRDANMHHLACELGKIGIDLLEVRIVPDDHERIACALNELRKTHDQVFTSGGIGPTHDDITANAVAAAFGCGIDVRADAKKILKEHYDKTGSALNEARLRMARIPEGATLIPNYVSSAPGFTLENVHVMAGVPKIFQAMLEVKLPELAVGKPRLSRSIRINRMESTIAVPLGEIAEKYEGLAIGSYPFNEGPHFGSTVVIRGQDIDLLEDAEADIRKAFKKSIA